MRGRLLNLPAVGRVAGFAAVAAAIIAAAVHVRHQSRAPVVAGGGTPNDSLSLALARCQAIGSAAQDDPACLATWAENRRRFFTYQPATATTPAKDR